MLVSKWLTSKVNPQEASRLFDQKVHNSSDELLYGVLLSATGEVLIVAALYLEYKLTRGLSQVRPSPRRSTTSKWSTSAAPWSSSSSSRPK